MKKDRADIEAERLLSIEIKHAHRQRFTDVFLISVLSLIILIFGVLIFVGEPDSFSDDENRVLQGYPSFSLKSFIEGDYTEELGKFYSDQFPFRDSFVGLKGFAEIGMLKMENNDVILGEDDYLIKRIEYTQDAYDLTESNLDAVAQFKKAMQELGIQCDFAIAPRAIDVMDCKIPDHYSTERADTIWDIVSLSGTEPILFEQELSAAALADEYVWFKTDHHWTVKGAYLAYLKLAGTLGYTPVPESKFQLEQVSDSFRGTTYSAGGIKWTSPDTVELMRYNGDTSYTVTDMITGKKLLDGFYDTSYLEEKDKYSVFLGGNNAHISVSNGNEDKPRLLIIKDSFAHSVIPFLAEHFYIEVIDLRSFKTQSVYKYISENNFDRVLIFYGIDSIATNDSLRYLKYGLK